jgi:prolyl 4-hydroxylase
VNLSHFIRVYDGDLDQGVCSKLVTSFDSAPQLQRQNGASMRAGLADSAWTELNVTRAADAPFLGFFRHRMDQALARYNQDTGLAPIPVPNSPLTADLIIKRYGAGGNEKFQTHFDSINHLSNRYLVFLWYLNDVTEGGATAFPQLGMRVEARAGRLVVFPPYWMFQHEGEAPLSGPKYILSSYLLFPVPGP